MGDIVRSNDEKNSDVQARNAFRSEYGDIAYLLYVPVDQSLLQALAGFCNSAYSCFTIGDFDLTPTIEEYQDLVNCKKVKENHVYSKTSKNKPFRVKLQKLLDTLMSWVDRQVTTWSNKEYLKVEGILALASVHPTGRVQRL
ncbi:hypothetical protein HRI_004717700 [Hibiscus trionum]|uniref:DUF7745 domain-containing protein n=1 Tax=Hibiscus trionum TaxID=183268 RepID=A0A9W7J9K6_HIBTR|nr:hypothetical protein HRI_004717700 [Hibiscus trionum]